MTTFLISGGRGLVGKSLAQMLRRQGHKVYKLTRYPKRKGHVQWNPEKQSIDEKHLHKVEVIINLAGANIAERKWSKNRKVELINSRVSSINFLKSSAKKMPKLNYYISASGINCYGYNKHTEKIESDEYGDDFLSELVQEWERASNSFQEVCPVAILRIAMVVDKRGGALQKIMKTVRLINLAGANIAERKWSKNRKVELINSRVSSINFLKSSAKKMPKLNYYISASGINCYGYNKHTEKIESDEYGDDFLSELVQEWERASNSFQEVCPVAILRIAMVVDKRGGALQKIMKTVRLGLGAPLGSGKQYLPWIHIKDLCRMFLYCIEHKKEGTYNAANGYISNEEFMRTLTTKMKRPFFFPAIPRPILSLFLGEMSTMLTESLKVSNEKIKNAGFEFFHLNFDSAITEIVKKEA